MVHWQMAAIDYIATGLNAESIAIHLGGLANAKEFDHVPLLILEKIHHDSVRPASDCSHSLSYPYRCIWL